MLDVIVIGMGAHGSAGLFHLAKKGLNVLGLEPVSYTHLRAHETGRNLV